MIAIENVLQHVHEQKNAVACGGRIRVNQVHACMPLICFNEQHPPRPCRQAVFQAPLCIHPFAPLVFGSFKVAFLAFRLLLTSLQYWGGMRSLIRLHSCVKQAPPPRACAPLLGLPPLSSTRKKGKQMDSKDFFPFEKCEKGELAHIMGPSTLPLLPPLRATHKTHKTRRPFAPNHPIPSHVLTHSKFLPIFVYLVVVFLWCLLEVLKMLILTRPLPCYTDTPLLCCYKPPSTAPAAA